MIEWNFTIESRSLSSETSDPSAVNDAESGPDLLDYCHRDALAMVRLVQTLEGLARVAP